MSRTIRYYQVAVTRNGHRTNFDFGRFINQIEMLEWRYRLRKVEDNPVAVFFKRDINEDPNYMAFSIGKFRRNYRPYIGHVTTNRLREIPSDVVELTTFLFIQNRNTLIMEYNNNGIKERAFKKYIDTFLPDKENDSWEILLEPIYSNRGEDEINAAESIRGVELKLSTGAYQERRLNEGATIEREVRQSVTDLFTSTNQATNVLDANTIRIEFGTGPGQNLSLSKESVLSILNILNIEQNQDFINTMKVRYKERRSGKIQHADLTNFGGALNDKILENIDIQTPGWELISDNMLESYSGYSSICLESYRESLSTIHEVENPSLIIEPPEDIRVPID